MVAEPRDLQSVPDLDEYLDAAEAPSWAETLPEELPRPNDAVAAPEGQEAGAQPVRARERWRIEDDDQAEWAMRRLGRALQEVQRIGQKAEERIERIRTWATAEVRPQLRSADFFHALLEDYGQRVREADEKRKTIRVPSGAIKTRVSKGNIVIRDEEALLEWAREHRPEWIQTKESILVSTVREHVGAVAATDGEFVTRAFLLKTEEDPEAESLPGLGWEDGGITAKPEPDLQ